GKHHVGDTGDVALVSQQDHVHHQVEMGVEVAGDTGGRIGQIHVGKIVLSGFLHTTLDLAHGFQIVTHHHPVCCAQLPVQDAGVTDHQVQNTGSLTSETLTLCGIVAHPKEGL